MSDDDEAIPPPPRPVRSVPTVATVQLQAEINAGLIKSLRGDIEEVQTAVDAIKKHLVGDPTVISVGPLPSPASLTPPPESRPSKAAQAARTGLDLGKWTAVVIGVLSVAAQVAAVVKPNYVGPITAILRLFGVQ